VDKDSTMLTITAHGPAAQGRLPLSEVARLCGEFQATIERIALELQGTTASAGRRPKDIVESVRLFFTGFHNGSAVLELRPPDGSLTADASSLLSGSLDVLESGVSAVREGAAVPEGFSTPVLDGLIRLAGGLGDGFITEIVISRNGGPLMTINSELRRALRQARREVRHDETTVVGLLQMGDFAPSALRCRIDTIDISVLCTFDESLSETVLACLNTMVVASGTGEFLPGGTLRSLDLTELTTISRSPTTTLDDLRREQGVSAWDDASAEHAFGLSDTIEDDDFSAFLIGALSSRGEG
jgi:hypothetical protein